MASAARFYVSTGAAIKGFVVKNELGVVTASAVYSKNVLTDIFTAVGGIFGGESHSYTSLLEETTHEAMRRMTLAANKQGANAVINSRMEINTTMNRLVFGMHCSVTCYGTAVQMKPSSL